MTEPYGKKEKGICVRTASVTESGRRGNGPVMRCAQRHLAYVGVAGALLAGAVRPTVLRAQSDGRLSVRPHEMATGVRTAKAGEQVLGAIPRGALVYVPRQCVGARRCPLVVVLHGERIAPARRTAAAAPAPRATTAGRQALDAQREFAERYGMILLVPEDIAPETQNVDTALKVALRQFAIDPAKIALTGEGTGGVGALFFGRKNYDVFSRVAVLSAAYPRPRISPMGWSEPPAAAAYPVWTPRGPRNDVAQLFVAVGIGEASDDLQHALETARTERREGQSVKAVLNLRARAVRPRDRDDVWRWLRDSWAAPAGAARSASSPASLPILTSTVVGKMTAAWVSILTGQDSTVWTTGLDTYRKELTIPVGDEQMVVTDMVDMPALAAKFPAVAAALAKTGLTAAEEEGYRTALISARATKVAGTGAQLADTSVLGRNIAFLNTYTEVGRALMEVFGVPRCETSGGFMSGCKELRSLDLP